MYNAVVSLQKRHLEALRASEGRGLSTVESAEHLETESGFRDLYAALEQISVALRDDGPIDIVTARAALAKARGEA